LHRFATTRRAVRAQLARVRTPFGLPTVRLVVGASVISLIVGIATQGASQAAPATQAGPPPSILPVGLGNGIGSHQPVTLAFDSPMDRASVAEALQVEPAAPVALGWAADSRSLTITPRERWQTDLRYVLILPEGTRRASGTTLDTPLRFSFTTQTAPTVTDFEVRLVGEPADADRLASVRSAPAAAAGPPADTASAVSARTSIRIRFSATMDRSDVERAFVISPTVPGIASWQGSMFVFTPSGKLDPSARYAVSLVGARDVDGNPLGGDASFSFTTAVPAQVVRVRPGTGASGVTDRSVSVWFSAPMETAVTGAAFRLWDATAKRTVAGTLAWNDGSTALSFTASAPLAGGHRFEIRIGTGSRDGDGNAVTALFQFSTKAPPRSAPAIAAPAVSAGAQAYALAQINAARKAYGFPPLRLDPAISAVAAAHALDQIRYGYFSHTGRDGSDVQARLRAAGISFGWSGENQCESYAGSLTRAMDWCYSVMMAEPYPGYWNHIANILGPNFTRVGFGYAMSGGRIVMTWDFAG
jgi:uncharacterized protein YkwD